MEGPAVLNHAQGLLTLHFMLVLLLQCVTGPD